MAGQVEETKAKCEEMKDCIWKMPEYMAEAKRDSDVRKEKLKEIQVVWHTVLVPSPPCLPSGKRARGGGGGNVQTPTFVRTHAGGLSAGHCLLSFVSSMSFVSSCGTLAAVVVVC